MKYVLSFLFCIYLKDKSVAFLEGEIKEMVQTILCCINIGPSEVDALPLAMQRNEVSTIFIFGST